MAKKGGNPQNFKPISAEERRKRAVKGGIASAKSRQEKKIRRTTMKEAADLILSLELTGKNKETAKKIGIPDDLCTWAVAVVIGLVKKATTGDPSAIRLLREILGEDLNASDFEKEIVRIIDDL
ncbi:MAG: hypothetical protein NC489_45600 [Ruminococcus flavefaciens]|nr:hypothetical protein [Ruminococcus flavefaciens]